ncbi:MAG: class I SAM-dependent DNA methyltransferase, partial [Lysinibacillus sp.]
QENLEKYEDPAGYDALYNDYVEDLAYIEEAASGMNGPVIELACGTGRLAIPMAKRGYRVVGVDIHEGMLALARQKAEQAKLDMAFHRQDCTELDLDMKAPLIYMTGNSFQHFLTNDSQNALFESVKRHLQPHGHFIFDTRNPILSELAEVYEHTTQKLDGSAAVRMERETEVYNPVTQILHCTTVIETVEEGELAHVEKSSISLRYTYPQELLRLMEMHGFELVSLFGNWKKAAFTKDSTSMVVHCRLGK